MAKKCEITGKKPISGHNVSHSQRHTKRKWYPNLRTAVIIDENGVRRKVKLTAKALKTLSRTPKLKISVKN